MCQLLRMLWTIFRDGFLDSSYFRDFGVMGCQINMINEIVGKKVNCLLNIGF